jgi:fused signal recognition particle receptor
VSSPAPKSGWLSRLKDGLTRTRVNITGLFSGGIIDDALFDGLETALLQADVGVASTQQLLQALRDRIKLLGLKSADQVREALRDELATRLKSSEALFAPGGAGARPHVIMVAGVNGAGKTTSIGKLAHWLADRQRSVLLAAGDTFRAAAVEQLQIWGERNDVTVIAQAAGADPAAVVFDALQAARARRIDVLLADTAGRLHTQSNLMDELKKVKRVMARVDERAPHEVLLVLDASQGQNALQQARLFNEALGVTGIVLTKLDGTAKGGIVFAIASQLQLPIRYIGIGESAEDFAEFEPVAFVDALLKREE